MSYTQLLNRITTDNSRYLHLYEEINSCKPKVILEVGTWMGVQALCMLSEARKYNPDIKYIGFDLFAENMTPDVKEKEVHAKKDVPRRVALMNLLEFEHNLIVGNTNETLPVFVKENEEKIDFVFIDGGHSLETIQSDWDNISQLMHSDTVVVFDDYYEGDDTKGCKAIVENVCSDTYNVEVLENVNRHPGGLAIRLVKVTLK